MENTVKFCPNCGCKLSGDGDFCPNCGQALYIKQINRDESPAVDLGTQAKQTFNDLVDRVNLMTGGTEHVELNMKDLVSNVLKPHSSEEAEEIFICGTSKTTPDLQNISTEWPKPWLYSRVFIVLAVTFLCLLVMYRQFGNQLAYPGVIFIGALAMPFSMLIFFFEVNAPRNISVFEVTKIFFIGGVMSLMMTLILYRFLDIGKLDTIGALMVGFIEEIGKIIVVAYFLNSVKKQYILNGLLVGAAVGAGFAVFETAGYIMVTQSLDVLYLRGILSLGGHVAWAGLTGAALAMVKKNHAISMEHLIDIKFLRFLAVAIILHGIWDMPYGSQFSVPVVQIVLVIIVWVFLLVMLHAGLRQISETVPQQLENEKL